MICSRSPLFAKKTMHSIRVNSIYLRLLRYTALTYSSVIGKSEYEDVLQCNNLPSSRTPRGHQAPAAFIILASGLNKVRVSKFNVYMVIANLYLIQKHGIDGAVPLPFSHLDIAAASGPFPGIPSSAPVLALARYYLPQFF